VDLFTDFVRATGQGDIDGPGKFRNLLTRNTYFLKYLVQGGEGQKMAQGGRDIRGDVMIREVSTFRNYKPGEKQAWVNPQVTEDYSCPWRFSVDQAAWNDQEYELNNSTGPEYTEGVRVQAFIDMARKVNMRAVTSLIHGMEDQNWAAPSYSGMELGSGNEVQSMALFSNELIGANGDGLYSSYQSGTGGANTVQGINKVTFPAWDNQRVSYDTYGTHAAGHLFRAFDEIILDLGFNRMPAIGAEYSDAPTFPHVCVTQKQGVLNFMASQRQNQDWFRHGPDDPSYEAMFNGIVLVYIAALDTAPIYPTAASATDTSTHTVYGAWDGTTGDDNKGPRYHIMDFECLHKIAHTRRFFRYLPQKSPSNQVTDHVIPIDSWHNNLCRDMRRQGIIYPSTDIT
jgi:hypothetical protein